MYKKLKTIGKKTVAIVLGMTLAFCHAPMKQVEAAGTSRTAAQVVQDMTAGWNLGNSLDSYGSSYPATVSMETYWGNPRTSKALIDEVAKAGFNTVRIPVSWGQYTVGNDYQIQPFFMSRVKEVVDYCISNNMYVILNTHHDISSENTAGCFYYPNNRNKSKSEAYLKSVWTQVANTFKNYDDHLVFETLNEPRLVGTNDEWWFPLQSPSSQVKEAVSCINSYNQVALNAIRATGGNNATRCIMVPGYGASLDGASVSGFALPKDTASSRLILSIHAYTPYNFALADTDYTSSFTQSGKGDIDYLFNQLNSRYLSKGIPVVIGEMSATNRNNKADRIEWAKYYFGTAAKYSNVACCLWDNNVYNNPSGANGECHGYINRSTLQWNDYGLIQEIMRHVDGTKPGSASSNPQPTNPQPTNPQPTNPQPSTTTIADGWYYLKNTNSQKYLTVSGNKASSGANVEISTGTGVAGQKWLVTNTSDGYITLTSGLGNFMLDVTRAANTDGANMEIYHAHSGTAQKFIVQTTKTANVYTIATRASNGTKNLDVYNHGKEDGTNVCQWTYYGNPNQQWIFEKINEASKPSEPQPSNPQPGNPQPSDPQPQNPATAALTGSVSVNSWGSGYVANFKIENKGSRVDSWTLRIKKNDVSITSAWNVEYTESGEYYVITPVSWNSVIDNGGQVEFGFGGNGDPTGKLQFTIQ